MCMGFINEGEPSQPVSGVPTGTAWIEQNYVSHMKFKDM